MQLIHEDLARARMQALIEEAERYRLAKAARAAREAKRIALRSRTRRHRKNK